MSRVARKPVFCAPTRSDTKWAAQPQTCIFTVGSRGIVLSMSLISCTVAAQPICASVYAYAEKQAPRDTVIFKSKEVQINRTKRDIKKKKKKKKERITYG